MKALAIASVAARELLHERVFYILLAFAVVGVVFSSALGQLTYADQAKLSLDFMLAGTQMSMVLFSIFVGVSLFQRELSSGSIAMVLSKPISRATFLIGKFFGQMGVQFIVMVALAGLTLFSRALQMDVPTGLWQGIAQSFYLSFLECIVLTAVTYFLATFCGPITTGTVAMSFYFLGHYRKTFDLTVGQSWVWSVVEKLIPNLEVFNTKTLASYGIALPAGEVIWVTLYALVCALFFVFSAILVFRERDIPT